MNNKIINNLRNFSSLFWELTKAGTLIVLLIVLVFLLLGDGSGPYVRSVILNIGELISVITSEAIIGISIVILAWFMISKMNK
ncbi:MAG: hypothetical protein CMN37_00570 [SAR116 cluster bacterium]|jgi:hypothetical protein|nr:hypothetical protein [SAR116 cluster bacterium]|tara:strand:- start:382 stop:630 length:249 start_codon:yes stop_codon:yes gene_type:complete